MKALSRQINTRPSLEKLFEWGKLITITGFSQVIVQGLGFLSGLLVIRLLPTHEYGLYTLANTMLGTMLVLADGGILNSVMAQGGKVWSDREKLGVVMSTGFKLRKKFATVSLLVTLPLLLFLLRRHEAGWLTSLFLIGSIVPAFLSAISGNLLSVGLLLNQTIAPFQKVQVGISLRRVLLHLLLMFFFPLAFVAILCAGLPQIWGNFRLRRLTLPLANWNHKPDDKIQFEILTVVKRILPGSIYYCLSGQITIWIISFLGSTAAVAQIGALGRLSMILVIFSTIFSTLVVPRFARLESSRKLLFKRFFQVLIVILVVFCSIVLTAYYFPKPLLWLLGKSYAGLEHELLLSIIGSCLGVFGGLLFTISSSRNWAIHPLISIPITIGAIVGGAMIINLSTLKGVLLFNILVASVELLVHFTYNIIKISKVL